MRRTGSIHRRQPIATTLNEFREPDDAADRARTGACKPAWARNPPTIWHGAWALDKPTAILVGWGMGRRVNGAAIVRALDALCAISGNIGIPGGGVSFYFKRRGAFDTSFIRGKQAAPRTVCEPLFGPEVLRLSDPPIRAVWVTAGNPVAMLPESETTIKALSTRDFVVVVDSFLTDTARLAHLVLPTTTLLEADDLLGAYGHHWIGVAKPVVAPPEGVKSDLEIAQELAKRVGSGRGYGWKLPAIGSGASSPRNWRPTASHWKHWRLAWCAIHFPRRCCSPTASSRRQPAK